MKDYMKRMGSIFLNKTLKVGLTLLVGILLGFILLCLVHLLPVDRMMKNVQIFTDRGELISGYQSTQIDSYTDSIMLNEAICPVDAPLIEKVIYNYQVNYYRQYFQQENLRRYLDGEEGYGYQGYVHYWGGHQVFLKLLLLVFDYGDILAINMILHSLLVLLIIMGLYRNGKKYMILPFLAAIISMMPIAISLCLQYASIFYIMLVGTAVIVWKYDRIRLDRMYLLFLVLGMVTSYVDFLTYPLVTLGVPLVVLMVYSNREKLRTRLFYLIQISAVWCVGYGGMWAGKWILGSILMPGSNTINEALRAIAYRGSNSSSQGMVTAMDAWIKNLFIYLKWPVFLLFLGICCYLLVKIISNRNLHIKKLADSIPYIILCVYPYAWYVVATNHSYEHTFTYRILVITAFSVLTMLSLLAYKEEEC